MKNKIGDMIEMRTTVSKRHIGHRSHVHGTEYAARNKKAHKFYENDEKRLQRKYIKKKK